MTDFLDDWHFTSKITNYTCPGHNALQCRPPNACARDPSTGRRYCCDRKVCWTIAKTCASDGSTVDCGTGSIKWCCVDSREICTKASDQVHVCWSSAQDTLLNVSVGQLNETLFSLRAATPAATTWPLDLDALNAAVTTGGDYDIPRPSLPASPSSAVPPGPSSSSSSSRPSGSLSSGGIAGVVIGAVAFVCLLGAVTFFLRRLKQQRKDRGSFEHSNPAEATLHSSGFNNKSSSAGGHDPVPSELHGNMAPAELPGEPVSRSATRTIDRELA